MSDLLPELITEVPGPRSRALGEALRKYESPGITVFPPEGPLFWERAQDASVWDADGNRFLDLTAGFAVASVGHTNPRVSAALQAQAGRLLHALGSVHPSTPKVALLEKLTAIVPGEGRQAILCTSGNDAVEVALKTARLASGRPGIIAFWGGFHGLGYGALNATGAKEFRAPFHDQLGSWVTFAPYPNPYRPPPRAEPQNEGERCLAHVRDLLDHPGSGAESVGAILLEPLQGRGGIVVPPRGFLQGLRELCDERGLLLILDEIQTGLGRTGAMFACDHEGVVADILCVGKGLGGGFPISACVGSPAVMAYWGQQETIVHGGTYFGNPLGCVAALAVLEELTERDLAGEAAEQGRYLLERLEALCGSCPQVGDIRGLGLMVGVELVRDRDSRTPAPELAGRTTRAALRRGLLLLASGSHQNVLCFSPPLTISRAQLDFAVTTLADILREETG